MAMAGALFAKAMAFFARALCLLVPLWHCYGRAAAHCVTFGQAAAASGARWPAFLSCAALGV